MSEPIAEVSARASREDAHGGAVRQMFDRIAPTYDVLNRVMSAGIDTRWRKRAVRELANAPKGTFVDLCAGTMDLTALVVKTRRGDRVIAVDFAAQMLAAGQHKAPTADTIVADALDLPFEDGSISGMICGFGVRNLSDTLRGAREARRVLKKGGVFVTLEFFRPSSPVTRAFHAVYARGVLPAVGGLVSGDSSAYAYLAKSMQGFLSREEYEGVLREAGFSGVSGVDLTLGVASIVRGEVAS